MDITALLEQVDPEAIYRHVLRLEGVRHPIETPDRLAAAAETIAAEMNACGLAVRRQEVRVAGWEGLFWNIEGRLGPEDEPAAVLINYYDTVWNTPGANDNAVSVAVALEAARVLAQLPSPPALAFVSATLEEGNPAIESQARALAIQYGLRDEGRRYRSHRLARLARQHTARFEVARLDGQAYGAAISTAAAELAAEMPDAMRDYYRDLARLYTAPDDAANIGLTSKIGSTAWLAEALSQGRPLRFCICLDEIGTVSKQPYSQHFPDAIRYDMLHTYRVDAEREIGDFVLLLTNAPAAGLAERFAAACRRDDIDLPHAWLHFDLPFAEIVRQVPRSLGSDHAAFWQAGIPGLFVFDTADFRNPFGHSMADTIDKVDFDQVARICRAVVATIADPTVSGGVLTAEGSSP